MKLSTGNFVDKKISIFIYKTVKNFISMPYILSFEIKFKIQNYHLQKIFKSSFKLSFFSAFQIIMHFIKLFRYFSI